MAVQIGSNMENANIVIFRTFAAIMFCIGVFYFLSSSKLLNTLLQTTRDQYKDEQLYQQNLIPGDDIVTYAELIATLFQNLDYDIKVNDTVIKANQHEVESINEYNIVVTNYKKSYVYDASGDIVMIVYTSIT